MSTSPLKLIVEKTRQKASNDYNFLKKMTYFFELRIPEELAGAYGTYLIPLIIPPESYTLEEPFTIEATPTQGGGLYVEENGIVQRMIKLEGTTGFKPRFFPRGFTSLGIIDSEKKSFSRELPSAVVADLSGQRHFQYLQDAVFRTYADLKRDPATAEGTYLFFHNPKDDEHWLVAPQKFALSRSADKPTMYRYSIELLVLDKAEAVDADFSEDKSLLDKMKNALAMVQSGLALVSGAINDLNALTGELTGLIKDFAKIVDGVTQIVDAVGNFANGLSALVQAPYSILESVSGLVDAAGEAVEQFEQLGTDVKNVPATVKQKLKQIGDGLDRIGTHPEVFETPAQRKLRETRNSQELTTSTSSAALKAASLRAPPSSLAAVAALGTGITPGEVTAAKGELGIGRAVNQYTSSQEISVAQGDTLVNLAAKYLGDARLWQQIAVINGLQPPFVNDLASSPLDTDEVVFSGTLGRGAKILIPSYSKPPQKQALLPVLGVRSEEMADRHLLGTDLQLTEVSGREGARLYDLDIDRNRGSVDVKTVAGVANISQAVTIRLSTDKGTDILYKRLGLDRVVSLNITPVDLEAAKFRFRECLGQDPRISSVRGLTFEQSDEASDGINVDVDVALKGFTQNANVRTKVGE